jgi:3-oxoacyl-[acyl-carrier-protein] synthase II
MELFFAKVAKNPRFAPPLVFSHAYANSPTSLVCIEFGLAGTGATFSEGATGALTALGWARDRLERTSGAEVAGMVVSASDALSAARRRHLAAGGGQPGEAGAALALELEERALERGARPLAAILGWGSAFGPEALPRAAAAAAGEAGVVPADLAGAWLDSAEASPLAERTESVREQWGVCGPAGSLLAAARICSGAPGRYLVAAADAAGNAAAAVLERTG